MKLHSHFQFNNIMARKKTVETENPVEAPIAPEISAEVPELEAPETNEDVAPEEAEEAEEAKETEASETPQMLPQVDKLLQAFPDYESLWITPFGGAYVTKPETVKGAILYKNPYYKS